jgi:hypothetical protein
MRIWVLLIVAVWLSACSDENVSSISSVETQNALLIQVVGADSMPVSGAVARVRATDYLSKGDGKTSNSGVIASFTSDSKGFIAVDKEFIDTLSAKSIAMEISDSVQGTFKIIDVSEFNSEKEDTLQLALYRLQTLKGRIAPNLSNGVVLLYGTDKFAVRDSTGYFEIKDVAPGDYNYVVETFDSKTSTWKDTILESGTIHVHEHFIDDECEALDCTETWLDIGYVEIVNFENGLDGGYFAVSDSTVESSPSPENAEKGLEKVGAGREGTVFHWKSNSPNGRWAFFGKWICSEESPCNLNALDSVEFYIRGTGRYSFSIESLGDANYQGKALYYDTLTVDSASGRNDAETWKRVAITPADFVKGDSSWGNLGWEMIHDKVTTISVAAYGEAEIWLDDIKFYGIKPSDLK